MTMAPPPAAPQGRSAPSGLSFWTCFGPFGYCFWPFEIAFCPLGVGFAPRPEKLNLIVFDSGGVCFWLFVKVLEGIVLGSLWSLFDCFWARWPLVWQALLNQKVVVLV